MKSVSSLNAALEIDKRPRGSISGDVVRSALTVAEIGTVRLGIWEVTPGVFEGNWTGDDWEAFTIISGSGTLTTDDGTVHDLHPGALVVVPPGTHAIWDIKETLRKTFVFPNDSADRR